MKTRASIPIFFLVLILLSSCATPFKQIKNINVPFERPAYSILPPQEQGWTYIDRVKRDDYTLMFRKKAESETHTFVATVYEKRSNAIFADTEEFLSFIKKSKELDTDPRRFRILEEDIALDERFGSYCVRSYYKSEDYGARNKGELRFLTMEGYGFTFIHPNNKNLIIDISYSERGKAEEMDVNFIANAERFINGLNIKENNLNH